MSLAIQARVVYPVDRPPIVHGVVTIEGERIAGVDARRAGRNVVKLGSVALLPGLVNAHTHLEFSYLKRPLGRPGMRLVDWLRLVIAERGRGQNVNEAVAAGLAECLRGGVTTLGDIATGIAAPITTAAADCTEFVEVIGYSRARAESALAALVAMLGSVAAGHGQRTGISPHAPYTVSPELLRRLIVESQQRELPMAMHLAESREELELLADGAGPFRELLVERSMWDADAIPRGSRPLDYLRSLAAAPRVLVVHGNYLAGDELAFLAAQRARMSLVYCPRTHAYFGHLPYALVPALEAGVRVALGTDSRASNPDLDLFGEMRFIARSYPTLDPQAVLHLGTLAGAEALGRGGEVGSLAPGKLANLIAVPLPEDATGTPSDMLASILAGDWPVGEVWWRGTRLSERRPGPR